MNFWSTELDNNRFLFARNLISIQHYLSIGTKQSYTAYSYLYSNSLLSLDITKRIEDINSLPHIKTKISDFSYDFADDVLKKCIENGIRLLLITDENYPEKFKTIDSPPLVVYYKGEFPDFDSIPSICIVGPRKASDFGIKAAYSLSLRLARAGFIVISGGALGCDASAHKGAIKGEGKTVAILGCGLLSNYLPENKPLRDKIAENSCLLSEYPPEFDGNKHTFPIRNRLMAALSLGVIVIEAGERSGALITANHAIDQGKDVFVIPGNPTLSQYKGSNKLLRDGAIPLIDASDVFTQYLSRYADFLDLEHAFEPIKTTKKENLKQALQKNEKNSVLSLSKEAKIVYNYLDKQKFTADDLIGCGISDDEILSALTELEVEQLIEMLPGGMYNKK